MTKINILITAVGGDIGGNIVNILSEQKDMQFNIIGTDINEKIFSFRQIDKFYQVDRVDNTNYKNQILAIVKENNIKLIIPISEKEISWFSLNRSFFEEFNIKIIINNKKIIDTFLDKLKTSKTLMDISVKTPKTYSFCKFEQQLKFPFIVKSISSMVSKDIYIVNSKNEFDYIKVKLANCDDYIIQEYVGNIEDEYTTTVYRSKNLVETISFKRQLTGGMTSLATIVNEEVLDGYAIKIAKEFDLNGSINIQSRKVGNDFSIFEINPRFSSTVYIRNYFGFKDVLWWIQDIISFYKKEINIKNSGSAILGYKYNFYEEK